MLPFTFLHPDPRSSVVNSTWSICSDYTCVSSNAIEAFSTNGDYRPFIQIRWQSSDLSILETDPLSQSTKLGPSSSKMPPASGSTGSGPVSTSTSSGENPNSQHVEQGQDSGLSSGAKAGIGVSVAIAVLLLCAAAFLLLRRYRASHARLQAGSGNENNEPAELSGNNEKKPWEFDTRSAAAAGSTSKPVLPGNTIRAEIDSDPRTNFEPVELPASSVVDSQTLPPITGPEPPACKQVDMQQSVSEHSALPEVVEPLSRYSALPEVVEPNPDAAELEALRAKQAELEGERQRIMRLQEIDAERARLHQRISQIEGRASGSPS